MAEGNENQQPQVIEESEERLKYLNFVQAVTFHLAVRFSYLYNYAKENSGPLKPGVQTVEDTIKTVVSPVYEKLHDVPFELLKFVDLKVDNSVNELERHVPPFVKGASHQAYSVAQKAPELARSVASEVKRDGVLDTATGMAKNVYTKCEPTAKGIFAKYEPVAELYTARAWQKLNQLPLFPQVAQVMVPTAAYFSDKYNQAVRYSAERGYPVSSYLPLVPKERIAKVFGGERAETETIVSTGDEAVMAQ